MTRSASTRFQTVVLLMSITATATACGAGDGVGEQLESVDTIEEGVKGGVRGVNRSTSVECVDPDCVVIHIADNALDQMRVRDFWYRVNFSRELADVERDLIVESSATNGIELLPILMSDTHPLKLGAEWYDYVRRVVARYPQQRYWQIWNEPNLTHGPDWHFTPAQWRPFLAATAKAIKELNPNAVVIAGGIASPRGCDGCDWTAWMKGIDPAVDRIAIHPYAKDAKKSVALANEAIAAADRPTWVTEVGWPALREKDEALQRYRVKYFLKHITVKHKTPTFYYHLRDVCIEPHPASVGAPGLALRDCDDHPKKAYFTFAKYGR